MKTGFRTVDIVFMIIQYISNQLSNFNILKKFSNIVMKTILSKH